MKKLLLAALLALPALGWSQTIPNSSFEVWIPDTANPLDPSAQIPEGWQGTSLGGGLSKVSGRTGAFAVMLKEGNIFGFPFPAPIISYIPTNTRSGFLSGYVRKTGGLGDTLLLGAGYWGTSQDDTIGGGAEEKVTLSPNWQPFSIQLQYYNARNPDSVGVVAYVRGNGGGYELDDLAFTNTAIGPPLGTNIVANKPRAKAGELSATLSPNPASGDNATLTVSKVSGNGRLNIRVVDVLGKTVWSANRSVVGNRDSLIIGTGMLNKGLYRVVVENAGRRAVVPFVKN